MIYALIISLLNGVDLGVQYIRKYQNSKMSPNFGRLLYIRVVKLRITRVITCVFTELGLSSTLLLVRAALIAASTPSRIQTLCFNVSHLISEMNPNRTCFSAFKLHPSIDTLLVFDKTK